MARQYPPTVPEDAPSSEQAIYRALQALDDSWLVFHSVAWQSKRAGREGDGEADFILVQPTRGVLILEVKGGRVNVTDGVWTTIDKHGEEHRIKNPFQQATDSKHALLAYLRDLKFPIARCRVEHAVAFPDVRIESHIGTYGPRDIILDRLDLATARTAISRIVAHWNMSASLTDAELSRMVALLAPTMTFSRRLRDDVAQATEQIAALTGEQMRALGALRRERRAVVLGGAGTGKTVLCIERARELERQGFLTAIVCYNAPLADWIFEQTSDSKILVRTFHSLCAQQAMTAGLRIPPEPSEEWWERDAPLLLVESAAIDGPQIGAILIDEGQDFSREWLNSLDAILDGPSAPFYIFADPHQELFRRGYDVPPWPRHSLTLNCRNTLPIAQRVTRIFKEPPPVLAATGPAPVFVPGHLSREGRKLVQRLVESLLEEEGLQPAQVVVLSDDYPFLESLRHLLVGPHSFTRLGGHGVVAETVSRFKGLEADAVILCLSDRVPGAPGRDAILYVGLSRARILLFVVGSQSIRTCLGW